MKLKGEKNSLKLIISHYISSINYFNFLINSFKFSRRNNNSNNINVLKEKNWNSSLFLCVKGVKAQSGDAKAAAMQGCNSFICAAAGAK